MWGCPNFEYCLTSVFLRTLWDRWKPIKDEKFSLGMLLSDKLNSGIGKPIIFIQAFNSYNGKWSPPHSTWMLKENGKWKLEKINNSEGCKI